MNCCYRDAKKKDISIDPFSLRTQAINRMTRIMRFEDLSYDGRRKDRMCALNKVISAR
jgi:hypothetical protein